MPAAKLRDQQNDRWTCAALAFVGAALLIYGSVVPFEFRDLSFAEALKGFQSLFRLPDGRWGETADWSVNLTIMIPIAFFATGAICDGRDKWLALLLCPLVLLACLSLSVTVEFSQMWSIGRVASSRDVVAQTLGACIGTAIWLVAGKRFSAWRRSFAGLREPQHRLEWILQAYVLGLTIYSLVPLNLVMSPGELSQKYKNGLIELVPFSYSRGGFLELLYSALADVLLFLPVGMCAAVAWNRRGKIVRSAPKALLLGFVITLGLELAQLMIVGRYSSSTDLILGFTGVAAGVLLMHHLRGASLPTGGGQTNGSRLAILWSLGAIAYVAFLAVIFWAPFDFTDNVELVKDRLSTFVEIPFTNMHSGSDTMGLFGALRKVLWFAPLGVLCGIAIVHRPVGVPRMLSMGMSALGVVSAAMVIELGQVLLPGRTADSTDVLLTAAGGIAGLWATMFVFGRGPA